MKKRLLKTPHAARRTGYALRWLFGVSLVFFCAVLSAQAATDLLLLPSMKSHKASSSMLIDVANVNGRLVAVGERGHVLYSDDNGDTWSQADVPVRVTLTAVDFPTAQKGWVVGHDGVVLHSEDAGLTWEKQLEGTKINDMVVTQLKQMIDAQTRKLESAEQELGEDQLAAIGNQLEDMREDLENLEFALIGAEEAVEEGPTRPLMDLWFKNDREGLVIGSFGLMLGTTDAGKTWKPLLDRLDNPEGYHYYAITRSGEDLFIAGEMGLLFRSDDLGKTWQRLESPYDGSYFGIIGSPEGDFVIAFGLRGSTFYSYDRGKSWIRAKKKGFASLSAGTFLSDGSFWIAGVDGVVLRSVDRGKTFKNLPTRFPGISSLAEANDGNVVLVGLRGSTRVGCTQPGN
jgi:photosystem II stability/assembly factor-like uncharacterized protein